MSTMKWSSDYELGNALMDDNHRELFEILNGIQFSVRNSPSGEAGAPSIDRLILHTAEHFAREEGQMRQYRYDQYASHKAEHERLMLEIQALRTRLEQGSVQLTGPVFRLLKDWLLLHMENADRRLAAFIHSMDGMSRT